jgi:trimeric autotransporter adhesin
MSDTATVSASLKYVRFGASSALTSQATGTDSMALGGNAFANQASALAIGTNARATAANSVAIGGSFIADAANTVSVGSSFTQRRITNVAAGTGDTDAVNLGQVETLLSGYQQKGVQVVPNTQLLGASLLGATASLTSDQLIKSGLSDKGAEIEALGTDSIAIGLNTHSNGDNAVSIGSNVSSTGDGSVAMGNGAIANGAGASALGVNASVIADRALAIGNGADGETVDSIAIGTKAMVGGAADTGIAIGANSMVSGAGSIVLGNTSTSSGAGNIVLGSNIKATGTNSVILGAGSDGSLSNVVSVGKSGAERRIVNVAAGTSNTDAVNLGQMNTAIAAAGTGGGGSTLSTQATSTADLLVGGTTGGTHVNFAGSDGKARELTGVANGLTASSAATVGQLTPLVTALGGGASIDATTGKVKGPTYNVQGGTQTTVGGALTSLDTGLSTLKDQINGDGIGLVKQDTKTRDINVGADTDGDVVNVAGTSGNRKITGVANGDVNASSFDAINGSQLAGVASSMATAIGGGAMMNSDGTITLPSFNVGGETVHNVGDAITNIDSRVTSSEEPAFYLRAIISAGP